MKFSTREDIEVPIEKVFARITDFDAFERRAMRQGAEVQRRGVGPVGVGTVWDVSFVFRGRARKVTAELTTCDSPTTLAFESMFDGLDILTEVDLIALSQSRTRISVAVEMKARTMTARLLIQTLKLGRARLAKRFKARVLDYAEDIEDGYRRDG